MQPLQTTAQLQTLVRHKPIVVVEIGSIRCCACSAIAQKLSARYKDDPLVTCASLSLEAAADACAALGIYSAPSRPRLRPGQAHHPRSRRHECRRHRPPHRTLSGDRGRKLNTKRAGSAGFLLVFGMGNKSTST